MNQSVYKIEKKIAKKVLKYNSRKTKKMQFPLNGWFHNYWCFVLLLIKNGVTYVWKISNKKLFQTSVLMKS